MMMVARLNLTFYMPTLPMILVNGSEGIGTGFSCYVPPFNPKDIRDNITNVLSGKSIQKMKPWFRGFKGKDHGTG